MILRIFIFIFYIFKPLEKRGTFLNDKLYAFNIEDKLHKILHKVRFSELYQQSADLQTLKYAKKNELFHVYFEQYTKIDEKLI